MGREQSLRLPITVSGNTGTGTISNQWDVTRWIRVIPPTEGEVYDMAIKDGEGHYIINRVGIVGSFSENREISLGIAKTIVISNTATASGTWVVKLDMH